MKVSICAVGRLRGGPESDLISDYATRFDRAGRGLGLGPLDIREVEDRKGGGMAAEAALLDKACAGADRLCALDERGRVMTSPAFAELLGGWRDQGAGRVAFLIGGADGLDPALTGRADAVLSLGKMVWPHMLARAMLTEQLYRATQILAGTPYHRA